MKLRPEEELLLKKLLSNVVLYKETYEEVYDHILTALEERPLIVNIHKEALQILNDDFGGYRGIAQMEHHRKNFTENDFYLKYLACLKTYIRNPLLIMLFTGVAVGYYLTGDVYRSNNVIPPVIGFILACLPWLFVLVTRQAKLLRTNDYKSSIAMETLTSEKVIAPCYLYAIAAIICYVARYFFWNQGFRIAERIVDGLSAILFTLVLLNFVVFFSVYFRKLKSSLN